MIKKFQKETFHKLGSKGEQKTIPPEANLLNIPFLCFFGNSPHLLLRRNPFLIQLESAHKLTVSQKVVIPAKAGIQYFQEVLNAPVSSTGQAPQVRHDGKRHL